MNLALWIIAGVLAFAFAASGSMKRVQSKDKLVASPTGGWAADWRPASIKLGGVAEILGAIGLIWPAALHVAPILVPLAAVGLILVMIRAAVAHTRRHELPNVAINGRICGMGPRRAALIQRISHCLPHVLLRWAEVPRYPNP